jgi:hypothetical protein
MCLLSVLAQDGSCRLSGHQNGVELKVTAVVFTWKEAVPFVSCRLCRGLDFKLPRMLAARIAMHVERNTASQVQQDLPLLIQLPPSWRRATIGSVPSVAMSSLPPTLHRSKVVNMPTGEHHMRPLVIP